LLATFLLALFFPAAAFFDDLLALTGDDLTAATDAEPAAGAAAFAFGALLLIALL
jgi:hypothetical protein